MTALTEADLDRMTKWLWVEIKLTTLSYFAPVIWMVKSLKQRLSQ